MPPSQRVQEWPDPPKRYVLLRNYGPLLAGTEVEVYYRSGDYVAVRAADDPTKGAGGVHLKHLGKLPVQVVSV